MNGSPEEVTASEYLVVISVVLCALFVSFLRGCRAYLNTTIIMDNICYVLKYFFFLCQFQQANSRTVHTINEEKLLAHYCELIEYKNSTQRPQCRVFGGFNGALIFSLFFLQKIE